MPVLYADPKHTSTGCSRCGSIDKRNRPDQATFSCVACGRAAPADFNAASHIRLRAAQALAKIESSLQDALQHGHRALEYRVELPSGGVRWLAGTGEVLRTAEGRPGRMIGVNFDISERRRAEDQRQRLMSEMQHRLRNLLTVVNAVVQLSDRSDNVELYREALLARLNAIQGTQRLLLDAPSGAPTLSDLLVSELAPYSNKDASNIVLEGPLVAIPTVLGIPLGLAVHELATNAAKYGALSVPSGKLEVSWAVSAQENGQ